MNINPFSGISALTKLTGKGGVNRREALRCAVMTPGDIPQTLHRADRYLEWLEQGTEHKSGKQA